MHITPFLAYLPDLNKISFDDVFYEALRQHFNRVFKEGVFKILNTPAYFIIEIVDEGIRSTGLITLTEIRDFLNKKILKHEQTIANKEKLHSLLFFERKAMIKPAALLIGTNTRLLRLLKNLKKKTTPALKINFPDASTSHTIWVINQPAEIKKLTELFKHHVHKAIIADGHHRFATLSNRYLKSGKVNHSRILTAYFTRDQMSVSGFFRIIEKLKSTSHAAILNAIQKKCSAWSAVTAIELKKGFIYLLVDQEKYRFKLKTTSRSQLLPLAFTKKILGPVFKINNETKSRRIFYAESTHHLALLDKLTKSNPGKYIFVLPPLTTLDVLTNKKVLPPKSTFFLPRIINGLIVAMDPTENS
ncbi:MAG: DUF1015 family protein [Saprospiraceae bacterium]|nr:DUF1015 family protein [Saprospiraceae bacterium]